MNLKKLQTAMTEAKRFLSAGMVFEERAKTDKYIEIRGTKEGGAARRASMDLTRALANLRKY